MCSVFLGESGEDRCFPLHPLVFGRTDPEKIVVCGIEEWLQVVFVVFGDDVDGLPDLCGNIHKFLQ